MSKVTSSGPRIAIGVVIVGGVAVALSAFWLSTQEGALRDSVVEVGPAASPAASFEPDAGRDTADAGADARSAQGGVVVARTLAAELESLLPEDRLAFEDFAGRFDPRAFQVETAEQYRWLLAHDFPSPAEVANASRASLEELEAQARSGDRKAAIFFADRVFSGLEGGMQDPALTRAGAEATTMLFEGASKGGLFQFYALDRSLAWQGDHPESRIALLQVGRDLGDPRLGETISIRLRAYEEAGIAIDLNAVLIGLGAHRTFIDVASYGRGFPRPARPFPQNQRPAR